ncbi:MAG TPA: hypothetical protein VKX17_25210 [Planctomycetota bacterium]|nr:hypothetical protein [Planctomycetota bacterium]
MATTSEARSPLKIVATVQEQGRVEFKVPFPAGAKIAAFIVEDDDASDLEFMAAASSSVDFWDNGLDDADWNNA